MVVSLVRYAGRTLHLLARWSAIGERPMKYHEF